MKTTATNLDQSLAALAARIRALTADGATPDFAEIGIQLLRAEPLVGASLPTWARTECDLPENVTLYAQAMGRYRVLSTAAARELAAAEALVPR
jgi:hypothetical protein